MDTINDKEIIANKNRHVNSAGFIKVTSKKSNINARSITIMGDSMIKELEPHLMLKKLNYKSDKLFDHSFRGEITKYMEDCAEPLMGFGPDLVILHTGTN